MAVSHFQSDAPQVTPEGALQVSRLLVLHGEMGHEALMQVLELKDARHFRQAYLPPALDTVLVEMTQPDSPRSPTQIYRLTDKGRWLANYQKEQES